MQRVDWAPTHACMNNLYKNKLHDKTCTIITFITVVTLEIFFLGLGLTVTEINIKKSTETRLKETLKM